MKKLYFPNDPSKLAVFAKTLIRLLKALKKFKCPLNQSNIPLKDSIKFILLSTKIVYQPE